MYESLILTTNLVDTAQQAVTAAVAMGGVFVIFWGLVGRHAYEEVKRHFDRLGSMDDKIDGLNAGQLSLTSNLAAVTETVMKHENDLYGKDGYGERIAKLAGKEEARAEIASAAGAAAQSLLNKGQG